MSVQSEITRITGNIASAYTAVSGKGGTLPTARNSANLPSAINTIVPASSLPNAEDNVFGSILMPVKGDIITMDLGAPTPLAGIADTYRVLSVNGNVAEVMAMFDAAKSAFDAGSTNTYAGKTLDTYLNTTWYSSLNTTAKAAIVDKNIVQYQYPSDAAGYHDDTHASYAGYASKSTKATVGDRHVYAIDVEDIEKYFGGTDSTVGTFSTAAIWTMFWNQSTKPSTVTFPWLRSAISDTTDGAFYVSGAWGYVDLFYVYGSAYAARPAFQIDLSKITWTPVT